jgi:hypothetical protein
VAVVALGFKLEMDIIVAGGVEGKWEREKKMVGRGRSL